MLEKEKGVFVAVSDNMKIVPDQIAPWVPGGLMTLGTDGFGRSDTRARLRRFFEVDAEMHRHRDALRAGAEGPDREAGGAQGDQGSERRSGEEIPVLL